MSTILACIDAAGGIGLKGRLPWHVSSELKHFKKVTMGKTLAVGSGTKLPPLPGREIVVLSRSGVTVAEATERGCVIIGGETIFDVALDLVDTVCLSVLPDKYECDAWFNMVKLNRIFVLDSTLSRDDFDILTFKRRP